MHPILLNPNLSSANRFRPKINAFAWTWGSESVRTPLYYVSGITQNWLPSSNDLTQTDAWPTPTGDFSIYSATEISGPSGMSAFGVTFSGTTGYKFGNQRYTYSNFVTAGITYTFSMYINVTAGLTQFFDVRIGEQFALNAGSPYSPRLQQIQPIVRAATTGDSTYNIGFSAGSSGWTRIVVNVTPQLTQRLQIASFQINGTFATAPTKPYYIAGVNFNEGILPTDFVSTNIIPEIEYNQYGNTGQSVIYNGSVSSYINFGSNNGLTYIQPLADTYSTLIDNKSWLSPTSKIKWRESQSLKRYVSVLKGLSAGKRAIYPRFMSNQWLWALEDDKFELGATGGLALTFYDNNGNAISRPLCGNTYHGGLWLENGVCLGQNIWNQIMLDISSQNTSCDYFIHNQEVINNYFYSFSIFDCTANSLSIRNAIINNPKYNQEYYGLTSWASHMAANGACAYKIQDSVYDPAKSYLSWDTYGESLFRKAMDVMVSSTSTYDNGRFINSIQTDAYAFAGDGTAIDGPPAIFGFHPFNSTYVMGNAPSPILYGWYYGGWDTNVIYGANMDKIKFSLSVGTGEARPSQYPIAWMPFLFDMQRLRLAKRGTPNLPMVPVIPSLQFLGNSPLLPGQTASDLTKTFAQGVTATEPVCWYADVNVGYNPRCGITFTQFGGNSAYFYELIRHACVSGAKGFDWWNDFSFWNAQAYGACYGNSFSVMNPPRNYVDYIKTGDTGYLQDMIYLNNVLDDCNTQIGGYTPVTYNLSRINYLTDSVISGAPGITSGAVWRATIKPGTIYEHTTTDNTNSILSGSNVGKWFNTTTITPPDVRPLELKDIFYFPGVYSTDGNVFEHGSGTSFANWFGTSKSVVAAFQGDLYTDNFGTKVINGRAYEFEMDPANPTVTSPWHNAIYENCIDPYIWGARSFTFFQPHGQIPQVAYPFREIVRRAEGYYTSTTDASKSPARWKGFTSGVRALLEGKLNPVGACAAKTGFTAMTEPCNVHVYLPSTNGYWEDRFGNTAAGPAGDTFYPGSLAFWDKCFTNSGGSITGANTLYYASVNQWLDEFISMKSPSITAGVLSCSIDATTCSATPNTVGLFATLPAYYTRGNSYELTDWYISQTLRANNIPVYCEARPQKTFSLLNSGITSGEISNIPGLCGATAISQWTNHLSIEYWVWYSNPNNPVLPIQDSNFAGAIPDSEVPSIMRYSQNSGPMPNDRDPYQIPLIVSTGGTAYLLPYGFTSYIDSPQKALLDLYTATDVYRKFNNLANTGLTFKGVAYDYMTRGILFTNYGDWARGSCGNIEINATANNGSLTGYYKPQTDNASEGNRIGYGPTQPRKFDRTAFIASTTNYANNAAGQSGYWTSSGISFWRERVKQPTFNGFLEMLKQVSLTGCPPYGNTAGWAGATYPNDFYGLGIFPKSMRP